MFLLFVLAAVCVSMALAQPQPPLPVGDDEDWGLVQFENGSQWYVREKSITAIHAIPEQNWEQFGGVKTIIYGTGFKINIPYTTEQIAGMVEEADISFITPKEPKR